ncbi:hypothetical protein THAPSDRAFT_269028 [Thalassiosira pseudonana CCMP1335]|uniref:16S rRNA (uracil(1498)-N(3))-methyltransferase n=1 Tax=Thalassiosira pseudonana TaxID=35128 RepID=B8C5A7_THAPS|nr:hypothetical protein THAPSDRAFT_269028 [Thalassiosira pseudonana CCMP1335]EED91085.1 hypothetical protein THAPSDRAFT_269028 [Thalassiosira pseudonana CCMP1335]
MVAQIGIDQLVLTNAKKVPKDYFGSHIFRNPEIFMEDELDEIFPPDEFVRVIAHPERKSVDGEVIAEGDKVKRMTDIEFPMDGTGQPRKLLVAVGPEGGWEEPFELDMFTNKGFKKITLGTRVLRSDVAVVSLLALAHEVCAQSSES